MVLFLACCFPNMYPSEPCKPALKIRPLKIVSSSPLVTVCREATVFGIQFSDSLYVVSASPDYPDCAGVPRHKIRGESSSNGSECGLAVSLRTSTLSSHQMARSAEAILGVAFLQRRLGSDVCQSRLPWG